MRERPKFVSRKESLELSAAFAKQEIADRKKKQDIFDRARQAIGRDLSNFLRAIGGGGGFGGATIMGLDLLGRYKRPEAVVIKEMEAVLRAPLRPWRSHQKVARRAAFKGRAARRTRARKLKELLHAIEQSQGS